VHACMCRRLPGARAITHRHRKTVLRKGMPLMYIRNLQSFYFLILIFCQSTLRFFLLLIFVFQLLFLVLMNVFVMSICKFDS
jgi:hypothetical protein